MNRREAIACFGGMGLWLKPARAQQPGPARRVGILMSVAEDKEGRKLVAAFSESLRGRGRRDGHEPDIDLRWAAGDPDRLRAHAAELVSLAPDVILSNGTPATLAIRRATSTVPVVFVNVVDPIGSGLTASLAQPGGNVTGFASYEPSLGGKWLEVIKELAPKTVRATVILNPDNVAAGRLLDTLRTAALRLGVDVARAGIRGSEDIARAFEDAANTPSTAMVVFPDLIASTHYDRIVGLAARHRLPAIYPFRFFVEHGGLIAYALDQDDMYRRAATYVDLILKGAKPRDLPVQQPTKFELVVNLNAAKALGLEISPTLLARADDVIE